LGIPQDRRDSHSELNRYRGNGCDNGSVLYPSFADASWIRRRGFPARRYGSDIYVGSRFCGRRAGKFRGRFVDSQTCIPGAPL
jgi:hypothetical protein